MKSSRVRRTVRWLWVIVASTAAGAALAQRPGLPGGAPAGAFGGRPNGPPPVALSPFVPPAALISTWDAATPLDAAVVERRRSAIEARLDQRLPMVFPWAVALEVVLRYVRSNTQDDASVLPDGLPFTVEPGDEAPAGWRPNLQCLVVIDLDEVPLRRTLYLVLDEVGLTYYVADGHLVITPSPRASGAH